MALQKLYSDFLASPNTGLLAGNASLHYITTLTSFNGPADIIKHLTAQSRQLQKKEEKFLSAVEGKDALAIESQTTLEFKTGGGTYLPSLDDNFLADRVVTFPIVHIVSFDNEGKIAQVRLSWDQGSLLKQIDVIGKTGRNWPIRDGKDQIKLIVSSSSLVASTPSSTTTTTSEELPTHIRSRTNSSNITRDPHASLSLFAPRDHSQDETPAPTPVAPRASAKPAPRDYGELFVGEDDVSEAPSSPSKAIPPKIGAGKNFMPSRLFDNEEEAPESPLPEKDTSKERFYRPNPAKFKHFDFGDEPEEGSKPAPKPTRSKHGSQWTFDDFTTPQKTVPSKVVRTNDLRHWGNSDDEVEDSPVKVKKDLKPRKDAETHFEFVDDGTPEGGPRHHRPRGASHNTGLGLYDNHVYGEENGAAPEPADQTNGHGLANVKDRKKDFDPHFTMTDDSPVSKPAAPEKLPEDRMKAVKMMDAHWSLTDSPPNQKNGSNGSTSKNGSTKTPLAEKNDQPRGIKTGGDGMGGRKGAGRLWGFGDESDGEEEGGLNSKFGRKKPAPKKNDDFWDF
ncbi:hypothetical protein F5884DRAFT_657651 [Xylogone sp. PMI_703]|nr:hypothetical protein F5884DRAFT_657651 [Xylogone sp. PMI_703]